MAIEAAVPGKVKIGGRELDVKHASLGFRKHKLVPWRKRLNSVTEVAAKDFDEAAYIDLQVEGILFYVGHNEPAVTAEWLLEHADSDTLRLCAEAAGQKMAPSGEASGQ